MTGRNRLQEPHLFQKICYFSQKNLRFVWQELQNLYFCRQKQALRLHFSIRILQYLTKCNSQRHFTFTVFITLLNRQSGTLYVIRKTHTIVNLYNGPALYAEQDHSFLDQL